MELNEAIKLIDCKEITQPNPTSWADIGCGSGLFTAALSQFLVPGSKIYALDNHPPARIQGTKPGIELDIRAFDFLSDPFFFKPLHGVVMANSLHYVKDKAAFMQKLKPYLLPDAMLLVIEYDTDQAVPTWVPYPLNFSKLRQFFESQGYTYTRKLHEHPSVYGRANIYSALIHL